MSRGKNHLQVFCLYLCTHIYSVVVHANNEKKNKEKERKKLKSHKCFWRTQNTLVLLHSEIPQKNQFENVGQIFSLAVQLHVKIGLITSPTNWKKQKYLQNLGEKISLKTFSNI